MVIEDINGVSDLNKLEYEDIDFIARKYGKEFSDQRTGIKTNQVRNFYSSIIAIRSKLNTSSEDFNSLKKDLILLKPKLAYAAGRQTVVRPLYELVSRAIDATKDKKGLEKFINLMEAIVAYHKFYGGKDK